MIIAAEFRLPGETRKNFKRKNFSVPLIYLETSDCGLELSHSHLKNGENEQRKPVCGQEDKQRGNKGRALTPSCDGTI